MDGYDSSTYGDRHACVYDAWYGDDGGVALTRIGTPDVVADRVTGLAGGGPVLELGVGTGRLALPLADRGLAVTAWTRRRPCSTCYGPNRVPTS